MHVSISGPLFAGLIAAVVISPPIAIGFPYVPEGLYRFQNRARARAIRSLWTRCPLDSAALCNVVPPGIGFAVIVVPSLNNAGFPAIRRLHIVWP